MHRSKLHGPEAERPPRAAVSPKSIGRFDQAAKMETEPFLVPRPTKPRPARPVNNIIQVDGSGVAGGGSFRVNEVTAQKPVVVLQLPT